MMVMRKDGGETWIRDSRVVAVRGIEVALVDDGEGVKTWGLRARRVEKRRV